MKLIYLYHPKHAEAKRVDIEREGGPQEEAKLTAEGWSRKRFAQILYHGKEGSTLCRTPEEVAQLLKHGWQESPITDAKQAANAVAEAVHAHHADKHRILRVIDHTPTKK